MLGTASGAEQKADGNTLVLSNNVPFETKLFRQREEAIFED